MTLCNDCSKVLSPEEILSGLCEKCFAKKQREHRVRTRVLTDFYERMDESEFLKLLEILTIR